MKLYMIIFKSGFDLEITDEAALENYVSDYQNEVKKVCEIREDGTLEEIPPWW